MKYITLLLLISVSALSAEVKKPQHFSKPPIAKWQDQLKQLRKKKPAVNKIVLKKAPAKK